MRIMRTRPEGPGTHDPNDIAARLSIGASTSDRAGFMTAGICATVADSRRTERTSHHFVVLRL
jgi:hypothetical protein